MIIISKRCADPSVTAARVARVQRIMGLGRGSYNDGVTTVLHRKDAPKSVRCFVLTISDTRTPATDTSGNAIVTALESAGHVIEGRTIVKDDPSAVQHAVKSSAADVVITTGGTGITSRDGTYEALSALFDKTLDGFGELFRMLSYEQIGSAAMMSRACAGVVGRTAVFSLPGSEHAVRLAMEKLIIPEMGHIVRELRR
jgi:molybdopterin adenylyltransferase